MRSFYFSVLLVLSFVTGSLAQQVASPPLTLESTVTAFAKSHALPELQQTANDFERLSESDRSAWLPAYYTALANTIMTFLVKESTTRDELLDKADIYYQRAAKLQPKNEELAVLQANIANARISVNPEKRWSHYGDIVEASLQKAEKLNPNNPRVTLLKAQNIFYTPKTYGGGPDKALPIVQKALTQFSSWQPASSVDPAWGENQAKQLLLACQKASAGK